MLSEDFQKRAIAKLEAASAGKFFDSNNARLVPSFDRGGSAATNDKEESNEDGKLYGLSDVSILDCQKYCHSYDVFSLFYL